jgi:molybdopterin molybdotransferase
MANNLRGLRMLPKDALEEVLENVVPAGVQRVPLLMALNRVMAFPVASARSIPPFESASMDGYALNSSKFDGITSLKVRGVIAAGANIDGFKISPGECYRIMTGAPLPEGADTVIEWELTDNGRSEVVLKSIPEKGRNVRKVGEDILAGDTIDFSGRILNPYMIGRLASVGISYVDVYRKPKVAVLATGDEISVLGANDEKIIDAVSPTILTLLQKEAECVYLGVVADREDLILGALSDKGFDFFVVIGGISTGDFDLMAQIDKKAGISWCFHKVEQKPGKPLAFGKMGDTLLFSLPGNPVASYFCAYYYLLPAVRKYSGVTNPKQMPIAAKLGESVSRKAGRVQFERVKLVNIDGEFHAFPYGRQNSNLINSMTCSDAFMELPSFDGTLKKGEKVLVYLY